MKQASKRRKARMRGGDENENGKIEK